MSLHDALPISSVIVKDANGNPVAQVAVTFAAAAGNGSVTGGSQTTNGSGIATVGSWTLSTTAGSNTLTTTSGSLSGSPVTFTAIGTAGASATMAKSSGDDLTGQVATRLQTPHVVLVSDANGNPVTGVTVTWAAASGGGSVDPATSTTDADGHAQTFRTLGILIGTQTTTATATIAGKDTTVTFSISATAAGASQMTPAGGDGQTGTVGTTLPTQLSVRVADQFNNPVAGVTVTWTPATGSGSVNPTTSTSNGSGIAATTWTLGPAAGTQTVQATGAGSPVPFSATGTAGTAATITANSPTSQSAAAGTAVTSPPSVIVKDTNGNPVADVAVTFTPAAGSGSVTGGTQTTNGSGIATVGSWTLSATAGPNTLTATSTGLSGSPVTFTATGTAGTAATIAANSATSQSATAGTAVSTPPSVIVKDANGNPVAQVAVTFAVAPGNGTITGASQTTNGSVIATVGSWTLPYTTLIRSLTATSTGLSGSPVTFTATGTAGTAATIAANSATSQSATAGTAVSTPPSVIVKDANGNPVAQVAVTFAVAPGNGTITGASQTTNGSVIATVGSWTLPYTTLIRSLTATSTGLSGSPVTFTATGTAGTAATIAANSATSQSATAGTAVSTPPSVIVKDANGNPVAQAAVTFAVAPGNGTITGASQTTNASGAATVGSWTLTLTAALPTFTATSTGLSGSPVTFTATGTAGAAATIAANSATSQSATAGTAVTSPPSVI